MQLSSEGWIDSAKEGHYQHKSMSRGGFSANMIVIHGTAGGQSAEAIDSYFSQPNIQASAHFIIGQDGTIIQGVPTTRAAWANGGLSVGHADFLPKNVNPNLYTISIEHVKSATDNGVPLSEAQEIASFQLIECLCEALAIPKQLASDSNGGYLSHAMIDPVNRSRCPGLFPWSRLYSYLNRNKERDNMPKYGPGVGDFDTWFTELSDGTWRCKQNGKIVMFGNKDFYATLSHNGKTLPVIGLPLSNEVPCRENECDIYYSTEQQFERALMRYDPSHRVDNPPGSGPSYLMHLPSPSEGDN
jgi:N-acetyl-anhydromuramyl-L-alanine amidase AmpD